MSAIHAIWRELYNKRSVDHTSFQAVFGRPVPQVPEGLWAQVQKYSM